MLKRWLKYWLFCRTVSLYRFKWKWTVALNKLLIQTIAKNLKSRTEFLEFASPVFAMAHQGDHLTPQDKVLSTILDRSFGLNLECIHKNELKFSDLLEPNRDDLFWGLNPESLWSNYSRLYSILQFGKREFGSEFKVVDIGCGVARFGLFIDRCFPEISYLGIEKEPSRVRQTIPLIENRETIQLKIEDFCSFDFQNHEGDIYFIFNPTKDLSSMQSLFDKLRQATKSNPNAVIIGWSRHSFLSLAPWLEESNHPPVGKHRIYRCKNKKYIV